MKRNVTHAANAISLRAGGSVGVKIKVYNAELQCVLTERGNSALTQERLLCLRAGDLMWPAGAAVNDTMEIDINIILEPMVV